MQKFPKDWHLPDYKGDCIVNVGGSILRSYGISQMGSLKTPFAKKKHTIFFLVDSLGEALWQREIKKQPKVAKLLKPYQHKVIRTTLPSTTNTVLTSLVSGMTPAQHRWIGYHPYVKELGGILNGLRLSHVTGSEPITSVGIEAHSIIPIVPWSLFLQAKGIPCVMLANSSITETPLSHLLYRGMHIMGYDDLTEMMFILNHLLTSATKKPLFIFAYWDHFDKHAHQYGPNSPMFTNAFTDFFTLFAKYVLPILGRDDQVIMTGDHGHLQIPKDHTIWINDHPKLFRHLSMPPFCEPRLACLAVKDGRHAAVKEYFAKHFKKEFTLHETTNELLEAFFGASEHMDDVRDRVGDFIVVPKSTYNLKYSYTQARSAMVGKHGGISKEEMEIPLLIWKK